MNARIFVEGKYLNPVKITLFESKNKNKYNFRATVLVWDPKLNKEWSIESRNGVRYNREQTVKAFQDAIERNNGIPVLYNHIMDEKSMEQLGLITNVIDTDEGLIVEGFLNGYKPRVKEDILTGMLNNVSLQVSAEAEEDDGTTYAYPTDVIETSFVPTPGIVGANLLEVSLAEAFKKKEAVIVQEVDEEGKVEEPEIKVDEKCGKTKEDVTVSNAGGAIGTKLPEEKEGVVKDVEKELPLDEMLKEATDEVDVVCFDIPLITRIMEYFNENNLTDVQLHRVLERMIQRKNKTMTMDDYEFLVNGIDDNVIEEALKEISIKKDDIVHTPGGVGKVVEVKGNKVTVQMQDMPGSWQEYDIKDIRKE